MGEVKGDGEVMEDDERFVCDGVEAHVHGVGAL